MFHAHRAVPFAAAAALLLTLAGCSLGGGEEPGSTGTDPGSSTGTDSGTDSGAGAASCVEDRTWVLDTDDLAAQLATQMSSGGMTVTESTAEGRQSIEFASDGTASASVDVTYTLSIDSGDGIVITVVQTHSGEPRGQWEWVATRPPSRSAAGTTPVTPCGTRFSSMALHQIPPSRSPATRWETRTWRRPARATH